MERRLLQLLTEGRTNAEIAAELDLAEDDVAARLARLFARLGTSSRAEATSLAFRGLAAVGSALMAVRARVDRHKCIGAGNCITLAPTAFDWLAGDYGKSDVVGTDSVDEELLRAAAFACPTAAIVLEDVSELLPWQLRGKAGPARRVMKTFMFTDIVGSTTLVEALGDEAWEAILRWHNTALREVFAAHDGRGDLDDRRRLLRQLRLAGPCRGGGDRDPAASRGAPLDAGLRAPGPDRPACLGRDAGRRRLPRQGRPRGVADRGTRRRPATSSPASATVGESHRTSDLRSATLKGLSGPIEVVNVDWR